MPTPNALHASSGLSFASSEPNSPWRVYLEQIERVGTGLLQRFDISRIGIGFGGPVDPAAGRTVKSHQVDGWVDYPIVDWAQSAFGKPIVLNGDDVKRVVSHRIKMLTLSVDGKVVDTQTMKRTLPMILQWDESFDIGSDTLTGVNDADYKPPFTLTAKLNKLTIKVDRPQLSPEDIKKLEEGMKQAADAK